MQPYLNAVYAYSTIKHFDFLIFFSSVFAHRVTLFIYIHFKIHHIRTQCIRFYKFPWDIVEVVEQLQFWCLRKKTRIPRKMTRHEEKKPVALKLVVNKSRQNKRRWKSCACLHVATPNLITFAHIERPKERSEAKKRINQT